MDMEVIIHMMPILARSTDSVLRWNNILCYIVVPVALAIMILRAIFGKKDK